MVRPEQNVTQVPGAIDPMTVMKWEYGGNSTDRWYIVNRGKRSVFTGTQTVTKAFDASTGEPVWSFNTGSALWVAHDLGMDGKQYISIVKGVELFTHSSLVTSDWRVIQRVANVWTFALPN